MKTLSYKQPWAWIVAAGIKPIENRTWKCPEKYIGERILIHASGQSWIWNKVINYLTPKMKEVFENNKYTSIWLKNLQTGAIIGSVEIVGCVINHPSIWAEKTQTTPSFRVKDPAKDIIIKPVYNWVLANPIRFDKPIENVKGKLSFWDYELPEEYIQEIERKLSNETNT